MKKNKIMNIAFICIEFVIYLLILTNKTPYTRSFCYLGIIVSFIYGITFLTHIHDKRVRYIQIGLLFTLIADFFLVALGGLYKEVAMLSFSITQISYGLFLLEQAKYPKIELIIRATGSLLTLVITFIVLKDSLDFLSLISMFYYFNILYNMVTSFFNSPTLLFKIGLVLFVCCDTVVGFESLSGYLNIASGSIIDRIINIDFNLIWFFYLPSQVLISYSLNDIAKNEVFEDKTQNEEIKEIEKI